MEEIKRVKLPMRDTIEDALLRLPTALNDTYARIPSGINSIFNQRAFTALQLLVLSPKPILIEELTDACVIDF